MRKKKKVEVETPAMDKSVAAYKAWQSDLAKASKAHTSLQLRRQAEAAQAKYEEFKKALEEEGVTETQVVEAIRGSK